MKNDGYDNENSDLVLRTGDALINHNPTHGVLRKYTIHGMLGQVRGGVRRVEACACVLFGVP